MVSIRVKTLGTPTTDAVAAFKAYIGQSGDAADASLAAVLTGALEAVGKMLNRSLLACTYELEMTERDNDAPVKLYMTPNAVTSVKGLLDGADIAYTHTTGSRYVSVDGGATDFIITYTTSVDTAALAQHIGEVWEYGKAKYEGRNADAVFILSKVCSITND